MKRRRKKSVEPSTPSLEQSDAIDDGTELGAENEDDLEPVEAGPIQAVVTSTDWTTETIVLLLERGTIELDPSFQRREAWTDVRKSRFIESLMMGLPIPQIVLAEKQKKPGQYIVIDGKQRLITLQQFAGTSTESKRLELSDLGSLPVLNGKTYLQIKEDAEFSDHLDAFRNQPIRAVVVKNWPDENFLFLVFLRLNTGSLSLAPQELRQALHPGEFVKFANKESAESTGIQASLRISKPDFRMRDVELFIRFISFRLDMESYAGNMKKFLDDTCKQLNIGWKQHETALKALAAELQNAIEFSLKVFPDGSLFSIWDGTKFEGRFNRTVFDIFTYYLSQPQIRKAVKGKHKQVRKLFTDLCREDESFRRSLQITTKSIEAVHIRFSVFGKKLAKLSGAKFSVPTLNKNNRLMVG